MKSKLGVRWEAFKIWWRRKGHGEPLAPHEAAERGLGEWGRVRSKGKATISARVYRAATDTWEDQGVIHGRRSD